MIARRIPAMKLALAAMFALFLAAGPAASQQVSVGTASTVTGKVTMTNKQITKPRKIQRRQRLAWGDTVRTDSKSKLQILLLDRSTFTMGANSRLTIDRFIYDPTRGRSLSGSVGKGAFRFMSGRRDSRSSGNVKGPSGSIGIRGTAVDFIVGDRAVDLAKNEEAIPRGTNHDKDTAMFVVLRGPGANTAGGLTPGLVDVTGVSRTVTLDTPSLATYIPRAGAEPIGPFRISPTGLSDVQDYLANNVARANKKGPLDKLLPALGIAAGIAAGVAILSDDDDPNGTASTPTNPNNPTAGSNYCQQNPNSPDC
ncbi:MAG: FecR family protein [Altererythrobacter sp.]